MTNLLGQLKRWRLVERLIRLAWGGGRWVAIVGTVLAAACLTDWLADRYLGSESWRKFRTATWVFAPRSAPAEQWDPNAIADETPKWLRYAMTGGQLLLAGWLAYALLVRPWRRTPPVDELASTAEKAIPEFGHRLVTAVQLNRPTARTQGMSQALIAEVTREAGEMAERHNLLKLVNYTRVVLAAAVLLPVLVAWGAFAAFKTDLATVLLKRQLLMNVEIPRTIHLENKTQVVWPTGAEVEIRYHVTGEYGTADTGRLRIEPEARYRLSARALADLKGRLPEAAGEKLDPLKDKELSRTELQDAIAKILGAEEFKKSLGAEDIRRVQNAAWDKAEFVHQPEEYYDLRYEKDADAGGAYFVAKLPPSSRDFSFSARLGNGRSREPGRVRFEAPPNVTEVRAWQLLPRFLGTRDGTPAGPPFERQRSDDGSLRGEVVDALPLSEVRIGAAFSKPVKSALLVPIERAGVGERSLPAVPPRLMDEDRTAAEWVFPTTEKMIAYRLELVDDRGFTNAVPIRRNVRMLEDRPPVVTFLPESTRHPDPNVYYGRTKDEVERRAKLERAKVATEWGDKMALAEGGRVLVIYRAQSDQGVGRANIRYRVIPRGVQLDAYPEEVQRIQHPREDPENKVYAKLTLKPITADLKVVGPYVPDLGLFERSWQGLSPDARDRVNIEFYSFPSPDPGTVPAGLEAGGRYWFEIDGLQKKMPDGTLAKLEVGDTVELFVEAFDKNPLPGRGPGYTREARRKIVVTQAEADAQLRLRNEENKKLQEKLDQLVKDQQNVFKEPPKEPPMEPKR